MIHGFCPYILNKFTFNFNLEGQIADLGILSQGIFLNYI